MTDEKRAKLTTPGDREIHIERILDAPRDRVFAAFTNPELIPQWWGPRRLETEVKTMDVRVGGSWHFVSHDPESGEDIEFRGTYREVTPPERISQTFEWLGMPGYVSVETAEFEDLGEQTRVVTKTIFHTAEERDGMIDSGMESGMQETYQRLDELLAAGVA